MPSASLGDYAKACRVLLSRKDSRNSRSKKVCLVQNIVYKKVNQKRVVKKTRWLDFILCSNQRVAFCMLSI